MRFFTFVVAVLLAAGCADARVRAEREVREAEAYERAGKPADAAIKYRRALQLDARHEHANAGLVRVYRAMGVTADALSTAKAWAAAAPESRDALIALFEVRVSATQGREALAVAERLLARNAGDAESLARAGQALLLLGRLDDAGARAAEALAADPGNVAAQVILADIALTRGDPARAEKMYRAALARAPGDERANRALAHVLIETGRASDAEPLLRRAAGASGQTLDSRLAFADYLRHQGRAREARAWLEEVVKAGAHVSRARVRLAAFEYDEGNHDEAWRTLKRALRDDKSTEGYLVKASFLHREGKLDDALDAVQDAARLAPWYGRAHYFAGVLHAEAGDWWKARAAFERARYDRKFAVPAALRLGEVALALNRPLDALQAAQSLPAHAARSREARALVAKARKELGY